MTGVCYSATFLFPPVQRQNYRDCSWRALKDDILGLVSTNFQDTGVDTCRFRPQAEHVVYSCSNMSLDLIGLGNV